MKKWITCFFTVCLLAVALSVTAFAAGTVTGVSSGTATLTREGTEKVNVTYSSAESGKEYLVLATNEQVTPGSLTDKNIVYIDQRTARESSVNFTVYPKELKTGTYYVYMSSNASSGSGSLTTLTQVGTYTAEGPAYTLGDVNDKDGVDTTDAVWVLQSVARSRTLDATQTLAANVDGNKVVDTTDAVWILQYVAQMRDAQFNPIKK